MFRSKLEDIMPAEELLFDPTPGFGYYAPWLKHAVAHPAKMNTWLLEFLIRAFTEPCDTVLDPMAGSGSTGVVAALHGRNAVQVELERKFWEWMEKARENVEKHPTLTPKGRIVNICGDARRLSELLTQVGFEPTAAITSPPYSSTEFYYGEKSPEFWQKLAETTGRKAWLNPNSKTRKTIDEKEKPLSPENIGNLPLGEVSTIITSPPYSETYTGGGDPEKRKQRLIKAGHDPREFLGGKARNAVLKHYNEVDVCITSPPYSDAVHGRGLQGRDEYVKKMEEGLDARYKGKVCGNAKLGASLKADYSKNPSNIANLPHGNIDAIITSPPYLKSAESGAGVNRQREGDVKIGCSTVGRTVTHPEAIDNTKEYGSIDAVITSPPYEGSLEGTTRHTRGGIASRDPALAQTDSYATVMSFGVPVGNSPSNDNIGNLKSSDEEYEELDKTIERLRRFGRTDPKAGGPYGRSLAHPYSPSKDNIGNLTSSDKEYQALIDAVITSPPYAHESTASKPTKLEELGLFRMGHSKETPYTEEDYREWDKHKDGNIGKRKLFIRVPCRPEDAQFHDTRPGRKGTIWEWTREVEATPEIVDKIQKLKSEKKGKSETYLEAMLKVYSEMFKVLKPNGLAIIIVKPFVRNKKVVDLPYHTWILMAKVGFRLARLYKLRLFRLSFWRILQYKKHPDVPIIAHEYVLVCQKPGSEPGKPVEPKIDPLIFIAETAAKKQAAKICKC